MTEDTDFDEARRDKRLEEARRRHRPASRARADRPLGGSNRAASPRPPPAPRGGDILGPCGAVDRCPSFTYVKWSFCFEKFGPEAA